MSDHPTGLGVLASYALDARSQAVTTTTRELVDAGVPVVWDSGGYSVFTGKAVVDVDEHAEWVRSMDTGNPLARFVSLDVIGDPDATAANYLRQRSAGVNVEPTIHYGEPLDQVDRLLDIAVPDWFNVGGLVPYLAGATNHRNIAAFIAAVRRRLPHDVNLHALGCCTPRIAQLVHFDAADSTAWLNLDKFRVLNLFDARTGEWRRFHVARDAGDRDEAWRDAFAAGRWLRDTYGIEPAVLAEPPVDLDFVSTLGIRALEQIAEWAAARHDRPVTIYLAGAINHKSMRRVLLHDDANISDPTSENRADEPNAGAAT